MSEQQTQAGADAVQEKRTFVEDGSEFKGNLSSSCHVVVRGKVEGEVMAPKLTVTESGSVVGDVHAEEIHSEGVLAGTIEADELYLSGQVRDDTVIRAKTMEVKLSQEGGKYEVHFGACTLAVGDDPRAELQAGDAPTKQAEPQSSAPEQRQADDHSERADMNGAADKQGAKTSVEASANGKNDGRKRKGKRGALQAEAAPTPEASPAAPEADSDSQAQPEETNAAVAPTPSTPPPAQ